MVGLNFFFAMSSPNVEVADPEVKPWIPPDNPREGQQGSSLIEGLLLCTCSEPCPDDRTGSIQYQDKEVRRQHFNHRTTEGKCTSPQSLAFGQQNLKELASPPLRKGSGLRLAMTLCGSPISDFGLNDKHSVAIAE